MNWENSIESYKTYLILEKALSEKSVEAYLNDIRKFEQYCIEHHDSILPNDVNYEIYCGSDNSVAADHLLAYGKLFQRYGQGADCR